MKKIISAGIMNTENLVTFSSDEFIFIEEKENLKVTAEKLRHFIDTELLVYSSCLKVEIFRLNQVRDGLFFVKEIFRNWNDLNNFEFVIKCATDAQFAQVYKAYTNQPLCEFDFIKSPTQQIGKIFKDT